VNYYERHLGDYARDTAHLSMVEHGAYTLLLDRYYATEEGIPADQAHRLARARSADERDAVDVVLGEFFKLVDGLWIHNRVEEEIEKAAVRISAARENGRKGGRPRKEETQQKPNGFSLGYENVTQTKPSEKLTKLQTPDTTNNSSDSSNRATAEVVTEKPVDPIWHTGMNFLVRKGIPEKQARSFLGKLRSMTGDIRTAALLAEAEESDVAEPVPWLSKAAAQSPKARPPPNGKPPIAQRFADKTYHGTPDDELPEFLRTGTH
jgi:uncharacterized protein YdaU (DUF1376 family)